MKKYICDYCGRDFEEVNGMIEFNGRVYDICDECFRKIIEFILKGGKNKND